MNMFLKAISLQKNKKLILLFAFLLGFIGAKAHNPFAEYGYTPKIATLSQGQFNEFHDQDTIVQIGSVLFDTRSRQIVAFVETDTLYSESDLQPDIVSRWISPDPLADHPNQAGRSPYEYAWSNPVYWTDPDGRCPLCPWLDAIVDVGFMLYDVGEMVYDYSTKGSVNPVSVAALSADAASVFVPMTVGAGLAVRAGAKTVGSINKIDNAADSYRAVNNTTNASRLLQNQMAHDLLEIQMVRLLTLNPLPKAVILNLMGPERMSYNKSHTIIKVLNKIMAPLIHMRLTQILIKMVMLEKVLIIKKLINLHMKK